MAEELAPLPADFQPLRIQHNQSVTMRVTGWKLGTAALTDRRTGEHLVKRALGLYEYNPTAPAQARAIRLIYQPVIDYLLPRLQAMSTAYIDVRLDAFGFRNRLTFVVTIGPDVYAGPLQAGPTTE